MVPGHTQGIHRAGLWDSKGNLVFPEKVSGDRSKRESDSGPRAYLSEPCVRARHSAIGSHGAGMTGKPNRHGPCRSRGNP